MTTEDVITRWTREVADELERMARELRSGHARLVEIQRNSNDLRYETSDGAVAYTAVSSTTIVKIGWLSRTQTKATIETRAGMKRGSDVTLDDLKCALDREEHMPSPGLAGDRWSYPASLREWLIALRLVDLEPR